MRPTLRVKIPPLSTIIMFLALLTVIPFPNTGGWRGMLFYLFGAYTLFRLFWNRNAIRWGHLLWVLTFYLLGYCSRYWAMYPGTVTIYSGYLRYAVILSWSIAEYIYQDEHDLDHICRVMLVLAVILACNFILNATPYNGRFTLKANANTVGMNAAYLFGFAMYAAKKAKWRKVFLDVIVGVLLVIVLLTGSRKSLITVALFVVAFLLFWTPEKGSIDLVLRIVGVLALIVAAIWVIMKVDVFYNAVGNRIESLLKYWIDGGDADASAVTRNNMTKIAMELFLTRNPMFGIGLNNFKYMSGYLTYSHSNYSEVLCSLGFVGFFAYYGPMAYFTVCAFILWRKRVPGAILPLMILLLQFINDFGQVSYYSFPIQIFVGVAVGYVYLMRKKQREKERLEEEQIQDAELEAYLASLREQDAQTDALVPEKESL